MAREQWFIDGRRANLEALASLLEAARVEKLKRSTAIRKARLEDQGREIDFKKLGAAIRKAVREAEQEARRRVHVVIQPLAGRFPDERASRRFDDLLGVRRRRFKKPARDGLSSFHCKFTSRGLGSRRRNQGRPFRDGETVKHLRYILRPEARELTQGGLSSNISHDPDELAGLFAALEELERQDRANSNVYMSLIISLPHELTPEGRERALDDICHLLAKHGLPYAGVLHSPDEDGDPRNFHAHIMFSLRPIEVEGSSRYAFSAEKYSDLNDESFIKPFRHAVADILNAAMVREGQTRRFTALSDADRGLKPRAKGSGKNSPGRTAWLRKQEDLNAINRELSLRADHNQGLDRMKALVAAVLNDKPRNLAAEVSVRKNRFAASLASVKHEADLDMAMKAVARAQPTAPSVPKVDLRSDPDRQAAIARAVVAIEKIPHPPLQRFGANFRIDPDKVIGEGLVLADRFDSEDAVQKAFAKCWRGNLEQLRIELDHTGRCPIVSGAQPEIIEELIAPNLYDAYKSARNDPEVQNLLYGVWGRWEERRLAKERRQSESLAAIRQTATTERAAMLARAPKSSRPYLRGALGLMTEKFLAGSVGMRVREGVQELIFADADDRDLASDILKIPGGPAFLKALGHAAAELDKRGRARATLSLQSPLGFPASGQARGMDRTSKKNDGWER